MTAFSKDKTFRVEAPPEETEPNPGKSLAKEMLSELKKEASTLRGDYDCYV